MIRRLTRASLVPLFAVTALVLAGCGAGDAAAPEPLVPTPVATEKPGSAAPPESPEASAAQEAETAPPAGGYVSYDAFQADAAAYAAGDVVLFFNASWCPTCQEAERNLNADGVPDGLTVVKVDYDSARDLRRAYGVTIQHTFVQVDPSGKGLKKWTGSVDGDEIASQTV